MVKKYWFLGVVFVVTLVLYFPVLSTFFTGDDFFHLKVSLTDGSLKGFINLFGVYPFQERGYAFYRPIFREGLHNIFYSLFGLNQFPFRLLQFGLHFINTSLVYIFLQRLFKNKFITYFVTFFFATTAANVGVLYYLAGGIQAQGATMFMLFTILLFDGQKRVLSFLTFIAALASHEQAVAIIPILVGFMWVKKKNLSQITKVLWPYVLVGLIYLYLNFFYIGFSSGEVQYQPNFSIPTLMNTLGWYSVWSLGLPESLVDFVNPGFSLNPNLMKYWGENYRVIFPTFFVSALIILISVNREVFKNKKMWFLVGWFLSVLSLVMFLPIHKKTYYLAPALPAFWGIVGYIISNSSRLTRNVLVTLLLILSIGSIKLGEETYWAAKRGRLAEKLVTDIKIEYPIIDKGAKILVLNDPNYPSISEDWGGSSTQAKFMLSGSDAFQLLYGDMDLEVIFEDDVGELTEGYLPFIANIN